MRPTIREVFATNLRLARQAAAVSQEELAHRADLDRTYISSLERCIYAASIDVLERISRVLGVEAADLLQRRVLPGEASSEPPPAPGRRRSVQTGKSRRKP